MAPSLPNFLSKNPLEIDSLEVCKIRQTIDPALESSCMLEVNLCETRCALAISVLLADDSETMRHAIRQLLEDRPEIELVGEAADFPQVMQMSKNLKPEVILIDLRLVEKTPQQRPDADGPRLLPMSIERDEEARSLAERLGANLLVDKFNLYDELIPAIIKLASKAKHSVAR